LQGFKELVEGRRLQVVMGSVDFFFPLVPFETMGFEGLNQLIRKL